MILAVSGLLLGLIAGSFIGALTWRWPQGQSIVTGRSRCDHCNIVLRPIDLIPVASFVACGGRCRVCGNAIPRRHLAIELAAGAIGGLALFVAPGLEGWMGAVFGWLLLALATFDVEHFWLPDRIVLPLGAVGLAAGFVAPPALLERAIGAAAGFAFLKTIAFGYRRITGRTGIGGGDPKLFAAIGAWLGWQPLPFVVLAAASLGLSLVLVDRLRGRPITRHSRVALGSLLAAAAWPFWLIGQLDIWYWP